MLANTGTLSEAKKKNTLADMLTPLLSYFVFLLWGQIILKHLGRDATRIFCNADTQLFFVFLTLFSEMSVLLLQTSSSKKSSLEQTPSMEMSSLNS